MMKNKFDKYKIHDGKFWIVYLHKDQTALGRIYLWYKENSEDLLEISFEAIKELYNLGNLIRFSLSKSFNPTMFNYLSLNNATPHLHVHIIPRYSKEIKFFNVEFKDVNFGKSYKRNPLFKISDEVLIKIRDKIKDNLRSD